MLTRQIEDELVCFITKKLPIDPVMGEDGNVYEREALEDYIETKRASGSSRRITSPVTGDEMGTKILPASPIKNSIEILIENGTITGEDADDWKSRRLQKKAKELSSLVVDVEETTKDQEGNRLAMSVFAFWCYCGNVLNNGVPAWVDLQNEFYKWFACLVGAVHGMIMVGLKHLITAAKHGYDLPVYSWPVYFLVWLMVSAEYSMMSLKYLAVEGVPSSDDDDRKKSQKVERMVRRGFHGYNGYVWVQGGKFPYYINYKESYMWFEKARLAGSVHGLAMVGQMLLKGEGVLQNETKGRMFLIEAAEKGLHFAAFAVAMYMENGVHGFPADKVESQKWFEKSLEACPRWKKPFIEQQRDIHPWWWYRYHPYHN